MSSDSERHLWRDLAIKLIVTFFPENTKVFSWSDPHCVCGVSCCPICIFNNRFKCPTPRQPRSPTRLSDKEIHLQLSQENTSVEPQMDLVLVGTEILVQGGIDQEVIITLVQLQGIQEN
jgi:hypothetical protein